jgi:hypothetical protein
MLLKWRWCFYHTPPLLPVLQQGHFLLEDPQELAHELALKDEAMATKPHVVFAAEERSLPAQQVTQGAGWQLMLAATCHIGWQPVHFKLLVDNSSLSAPQLLAYRYITAK